MSQRRFTGGDVFNEALDRMLAVYEQGHRVVLSFSAGKDSGVCLELCALAARMVGRLPVEVVMRDEEIMLPGTYEYAERVAERTGEVTFHWVVANQPVINVFNRAEPYFWVFDPQLPPERWVRQPPAIAYKILEQNITSLITAQKFPPESGKDLIEVVGLRTSESAIRRAGLHSSGGYLTKPTARGTRKARPIYDWADGDVWKAIRDNRWDYNRAYDTMLRLGTPRAQMRIGPPTMSHHSIANLIVGHRGWPQWFDRVAERCPGVRTAAMFGARAVTPIRRLGESWRDCYMRECVREAPADWIRERSETVAAHWERFHAAHSTSAFPDAVPCGACSNSVGSWKKLALAMYNGNPFSLKMATFLPFVEPEFFRSGAGTWGGAPTW